MRSGQGEALEKPEPDDAVMYSAYDMGNDVTATGLAGSVRICCFHGHASEEPVCLASVSMMTFGFHASPRVAWACVVR